MDRWGEKERMPAIYFHSFILHLCCPLSGHPWKLERHFSLLAVRVMEITNVPGAQAGSIPQASLVGCYGALLLFCCSRQHHISWPAFGTGSAFRRHCLNLASSLLVPQTEFRARWKNRTTVRYRKGMSKFRDCFIFPRES